MMARAQTDPPQQTSAEHEAVTHKLARLVVAGHSDSAEECAYFLTMLGIDASPADATKLSAT